jgi:hypothetical protein
MSAALRHISHAQVDRRRVWPTSSNGSPLPSRDWAGTTTLFFQHVETIGAACQNQRLKPTALPQRPVVTAHPPDGWEGTATQLLAEINQRTAVLRDSQDENSSHPDCRATHGRGHQKGAILAAHRAGAWKSCRAHRTIAAEPGICCRPSTFHVSADRNARVRHNNTRVALSSPDPSQRSLWQTVSCCWQSCGVAARQTTLPDVLCLMPAPSAVGAVGPSRTA